MARVKLDMPLKQIFTCFVKVRISDINYGTHLGNDALVSILHEARVQWLTSLQYSELNIGGAALIMADLMVEYKAESFYGDNLKIDLLVGDVNKISFELYYKITNTKEDKLLMIANAKTGMVCYDYKLKKVVKLPDAFAKCLTNTF